MGGDGDLVHVHYEDTGDRTGTSITHGRKRQAGCQPASDTRNLVLGVGKDVAGVDSSLADDQSRMVGAGNGSQKGKKQIILEIRSVQRDEFHRLGDIRVDGPINIKAGGAWRLRQVIQATVPAMAVLAEDELARSVGGFRRCEAL